MSLFKIKILASFPRSRLKVRVAGMHIILWFDYPGFEVEIWAFSGSSLEVVGRSIHSCWSRSNLVVCQLINLRKMTHHIWCRADFQEKQVFCDTVGNLSTSKVLPLSTVSFLFYLKNIMKVELLDWPLCWIR